MEKTVTKTRDGGFFATDSPLKDGKNTGEWFGDECPQKWLAEATVKGGEIQHIDLWWGVPTRVF